MSGFDKVMKLKLDPGFWSAAFMVATAMGRRVDQQPENYTLANFRQWVDRSRKNLGTDRDYGSLIGDHFCSLVGAHLAARRSMNRSLT